MWPYNDVSMCENIYIIPGQQFYMLDDDARIISNLWHHKVDHFMWGAHFIKQDITQPAELSEYLTNPFINPQMRLNLNPIHIMHPGFACKRRRLYTYGDF